MAKASHGITYDVIYTDDPKVLGDPNSGTFCFGLTDPLREIVYIRKGLKEGRKRATLYHELTHVAMDKYGLSDGGKQFSEEDVAMFMGAFADFLHAYVEREMKRPEEETEKKNGKE